MKLLKRILKSEAGHALPMALILLVLEGLLVVPTLAFMTTNLTANRIVKEKNLETYAADAGVENALWSIQDDPGILPAQANTLPLPFPDPTINGMSTVTTTITNEGSRIYRINSIATSPDRHDTEVVAYLKCISFSNLLEGAITSNGEIKVTNSYIDGMIFHNDDDPKIVNKNPDNPPPVREEQTNWPTWDDLSPLYLSQVAGHDYTGSDPLYINSLPSPPTLGPIYRDGSLTIDNKTAGLALTLTDTLYVTGNLIFPQATNYTINLNGQTMFVHGTEGAAWAIDLPSNSVTVTGSGCIIADGNIRFMPGISSDKDEYVLVMSLSGTTYMKPGGPFYGSLVGNAEVDLQNSTLTWTDPSDKNLNFPGTEIGGEIPGSGAGTILTYTIK